MAFLGRMMSKYVVGLHLWKIKLLWSENWSRSCNSNPTNKWFSRDLKMLHCPESYKGSCSSKSSFAMYSHSTFLIFNNVYKFLNDFKCRRSPIRKNQIMMFNSLFRKSTCFISMIIESNDHGNPQFFKHRHIISRRKDAILRYMKNYSIFINRLIVGWTESNKLVW